VRRSDLGSETEGLNDRRNQEQRGEPRQDPNSGRNGNADPELGPTACRFNGSCHGQRLSLAEVSPNPGKIHWCNCHTHVRI